MTAGEGRPVFFSFREKLRLFLEFWAVAGIVVIAASWAFPRAFPEVAAIPERLAGLEQGLNHLQAQIGDGQPRMIEFIGAGILDEDEVQPGDTISVTFVLRRRIDCETDILVRFYDHDRNTIDNNFSYLIPAVKAGVSLQYRPFTVAIRIPDDMPPGHYSYLPEIRPINCGVYRVQVPPMSETFTVIG